MRNSSSRWMSVVIAGAAVLGAQAALADDGRKAGWERNGKNYPSRGSEIDYARVIDADPIVRRVRVSEPRRECFEETRYENRRVSDAPRGGSGANPRNWTLGPTLIGGAIGAAVGNQVGDGSGRTAARVAGGLLGAAIGNQVANGSRRPDDRYVDAYYEEARPYTVQRCETRYDERWDERIEGYDVTYEYNGRRYQTRMPYDPGKRLRVAVDVRPLGDS